MGLKALAVAALQQCAPRTIERALSEAMPAQSPPQKEVVRALCDASEATVAAANDGTLTADVADKFWQTLRARIYLCDALIHRLCDLRGDNQDRRADLLAVRRRMAPVHLDEDIEYLRAEIVLLERQIATINEFKAAIDPGSKD